MTELTVLQRRLIYLGVIVVLFVLILWIQGSWIDPARRDHKLTEETLGDVDETSFAMNLVLAGFRGIAANLLWGEARQMQHEQNHEGLKAVYYSIAKLQPHFITVWIYQAWNLAWNISVEWDDTKDKYWWIIEGWKFLKQGHLQNTEDPDLLWHMGWIFFQKIGKADEAELFRRYWKEDDEHNSDKIDNFAQSERYFIEAANRVRFGGRNPKTMGITPFLTYPAHAIVERAEHLERDGVFGELATEKWREGLRAFIELAEVLNLGEPAKRDYQQQKRAIMINYDAWVARCKAEIDLVDARMHFYLGARADQEANFPKALLHYRKGVDLWNAAVKNHSAFGEDEANAEYPYLMKQRVKELEEQIEPALPKSTTSRPAVPTMSGPAKTTAPPAQNR